MCKAADILSRMAREIPRFGGRLSDFAASTELLDNLACETLRRDAMALAVLVADELAQFDLVAARLDEICAGDDWAAREVAGRFASACERLRLVRTIKRHARVERFEGLIRALERGRCSEAQLDLARRLATETGSPASLFA